MAIEIRTGEDHDYDDQIPTTTRPPRKPSASPPPPTTAIPLRTSNPTKRRAAKRSDGALVFRTAAERAVVDLIEELAQNPRQYAGQEWIALLNFPHTLRMTIDAVRSRVAEIAPERPSISSAVACCMSAGLHTIASHGIVRDLLKTRVEFDTSKYRTADAEGVWMFLQRFPVSVPDERMGGLSRLNVTLPPAVKTRLYEMAEELGTTASTLGVIALGVALYAQDFALKGHRKALGKMVRTFYRKLEDRVEIAHLMMQRASQFDPDKDEETEED